MHRKVVPLFNPLMRAQAAFIERYEDNSLRFFAKFLTGTIDAARHALDELDKEIELSLHNS